MTPTLWVTNWSSKALHGPGRKLTIMALPREWEHGDGVVRAFRPEIADLRAIQAGNIDVGEYRRRFEAGIAEYWSHSIAPNGLTAFHADREPLRRLSMVRDGDTLLCACSRKAAARGECHRVWAAKALVRAGWRVVLDGVEVARG